MHEIVNGFFLELGTLETGTCSDEDYGMTNSYINEEGVLFLSEPHRR